MDRFFKAKSVAIIGASKNPNKVGHVIFRNFIGSKFKGKFYPINPSAEEILGYECYPSVAKIKDKIELAVIAVPAEIVPKVTEECGKKGIKNVVIISSGFKEIGNVKLEEKLYKILEKYRIKCIGTNCLGIFDSHSGIDTLFLPMSRLKRPKEGGISFVCQSGAIGSTILDLAEKEGYGFAKFISYGNATNTDETDLIKYLGNDKQTKVICLYIEGIKDGKKFMEVAGKIAKKKPIIVTKGGLTEAGSKATLSHTGSLAGSAEIYLSAFKQIGLVKADTLEEMFNFARVFEKAVKPKGNSVQIITNGGGYGILATDAVIKNRLKMAEPDRKIKKELKKVFPKIVIVGNPMDLIGDATTERYKIAIDACLKDKNIDIILVILLYQTPLITTDIVDIIVEFNDLKKKPIIVVSAGGEFTEVLKKNLEQNGVPCFMFPWNAVKAIREFVRYYSKRSKTL